MTSKINKAFIIGKKLRSNNKIIYNIPKQQSQQPQQPQQQSTQNKLFTDLLLGTQKINKIQNNGMISLNNIKKERDLAYQNAINSRTNTPYKNILPPEYFKKNIKSGEDLIVYKVAKDIAYIQNIKQNTMKLKNTRHDQDIELKNEFSDNNKQKYQKIFEHNNNIKCDVEYTEKNTDQLKNEALEFYENKQKENDINKTRIDEMIEILALNKNI